MTYIVEDYEYKGQIGTLSVEYNAVWDNYTTSIHNEFGVLEDVNGAMLESVEIEYIDFVTEESEIVLDKKVIDDIIDDIEMHALEQEVYYGV